MPTVIKWIFRIDYRLNFEMLNSPGTVLSCLFSEGDDFWDSVNEAANKRTFTGSIHKANSQYYHLSIDPQFIVAISESALGSNLASLSEDRTFNSADRLIERVLSQFKISNIERAGIRLFIFDGERDTLSDNVGSFMRLVNRDYFNSLSGELGDINDLAVILEGCTNDKINYRHQFGPYTSQDRTKFYENLKLPEENPSESIPYKMCFDIDLSEKNISFSGLTMKRWCKTKWPKADDVVKSVMRQFD